MCARNTAVVLWRGRIDLETGGGVRRSLSGTSRPPQAEAFLTEAGMEAGGADCLHFLLAMRLFLVASMS